MGECPALISFGVKDRKPSYIFTCSYLILALPCALPAARKSTEIKLCIFRRVSTCVIKATVGDGRKSVYMMSRLEFHSSSFFYYIRYITENKEIWGVKIVTISEIVVRMLGLMDEMNFR